MLLFEWFYNHPALRYGGYCLVVLILSLPLSIIIEKFKSNKKIIIKKSLIILIITLSIFFIRNANRIYKEITKYEFKIIEHSSYKVSTSYFGITNKINELINNYNSCNKFEFDRRRCPEVIKIDNILVGKFLNKYYFRSFND